MGQLAAETRTLPKNLVGPTLPVLGEPTPWYLKLAITAYLIAFILGAAHSLLSLWVGEASWALNAVGFTHAMLSNARVVSFMFAMLGGILGAITLAILFFFQHASVLNDFSMPHIWGYVLSPWVGAVLGLIIFSLVQGGLLVFAASSSPRDAEVANLGYLGLGFLVGFGWQRVTMKLRQMVDNVFASSSEHRTNNSTTQLGSAAARESGGSSASSGVLNDEA